MSELQLLAAILERLERIDETRTLAPTVRGVGRSH